MLSVELVGVDGPLDEVRALFQEYWESFGFTPCFQGFGEELAGLPGKYAAPGGGLLLARLEEEPAGCVAFRRVDAVRCEAKRLYVRPEFRGRGIASHLLDRLVAEARSVGYRQILGDTLPVMDAAVRLYERYGFRQATERMPAADGTIYLEYPL